MSENIRTTCIMTFRTSLDNNRAIRIPNPRPNLNIMHVNSAASQIVPADLFDETVGQLVSFVGAVTQTVSRIVLI